VLVARRAVTGDGRRSNGETIVSDELRWLSATELGRRIGDREISPVEVVTACVERIEVLDQTFHAFITVAAGQALDQARRAEAAVQRGDVLGPLHGVPVALKDELWTSDMRSTGGSLLFGRFVPERDGVAVERLRQAGAIVIGKTNMPEFAAWPRSKTRLGDEAVNPWDPARIAGASSGGSAAAVAAGMVPIAIGSDGGGSTRIPSALCGVVGLYPTPGRVPSYGSFSYSPAGSLGPIARDVTDIAVVESVIAGPHRGDGGSLSEEAPDVLAALGRGVGGLRIAWSDDFGRIPVDERIAAAGWGALDSLASLGAIVELTPARIEHPWGDGEVLVGLQKAVADGHWDLDDELPLPDLSSEQSWMWDVFRGHLPLTADPRFEALCRRHADLLTPPSRLRYDTAPGAGTSTSEGPTPEELRSSMEAVLETHDVLCSPTMATVAPVAPVGWATPYGDPYMGTNFTFIANSTGCAAASVPTGLVEGLPVAVQVIGRPGDEATVLRVCHAIETVTGGTRRPPNATAPPAAIRQRGWKERR
jgi:Asp-tRNA(Asn)/Glu-tRNA(Gln) amidotransferase A subunit family amidase